MPTPEERQQAAAGKTPIITNYSVVLNDDRKFALLELVADDAKALEAVLKSDRAYVKRFDLQKCKAKAEDVELEFRKYKKVDLPARGGHIPFLQALAARKIFILFLLDECDGGAP